MKYCKDCRFYEKGRCSEKNAGTGATFTSCSKFSAYSTRSDSDFKYCKDCRFYAGGKCTEKNCGTGATFTKCSHGSVCR